MIMWPSLPWHGIAREAFRHLRDRAKVGYPAASSLRNQAIKATVDMVFERYVLDSWLSGPSGLEGYQSNRDSEPMESAPPRL